jgi:hypothetical protein
MGASTHQFRSDYPLLDRHHLHITLIHNGYIVEIVLHLTTMSFGHDNWTAIKKYL